MYGDFEVIDVQPADDMRNSAKQIWTLKCVHCGAIRTTRNGKDYVTGKNSGHCACMKEERKAVKLARIAAAREEREKIRKNKKKPMLKKHIRVCTHTMTKNMLDRCLALGKCLKS